MKHFKLNTLALVLSGTALLWGCGSDNDAVETVQPPAPEPQVLTGVFLDSPVEGLGFSTASQSGLTDADGQFNYLAGEAINFTLGGIAFPEVTASAQVTPLTLFATDDPRTIEVVNTLRLLQSLDSNGVASGGITITAETTQALAGTTLDLSSEAFDAPLQQVMTTAGMDPDAMVSADAALAHFDDTLNPGYDLQDLDGNWLSFEFLTPRFGHNSEDSFDYRLAKWVIDTGILAVDEQRIDGTRFDREEYAIVIDDTGRITANDESENWIQLDSTKQMMLWWDGESHRQRIATSIKQAEHYAQSDLAGEWIIGNLYTPAHQIMDPGLLGTGLYHLTIDSEGATQLTDLKGTDEDENFTLNLNAHGRVMEDNQGYIQLSANKDVMVQVAVWDQLEQELMIGLKQPQTHVLAELEGNWFAVGLEIPLGENDAYGYSYDIDSVTIDSEGLMQWTHEATDDNEAELGLTENWQLTLEDNQLTDAESGRWIVNASYTVMFNIYPTTEGEGFAILIRR
ncbi:hypothetical protein L2750_01015 [Shewanella submarina]|uniref:Carboxypeptidase regulatory-like domain-containing protein n=1 Tax=Shewanella submarina TaxID=2016376 RepID=A0ABV7GH85_9GAMM|nr:hypothetical protein [Shewanella submarina]MCL1035740.1 hypothetical protein [Shewanella submarina]